MSLNMPQCLRATLDRFPVVLADAGAAGGIHSRWFKLQKGLKVLGFEPDRREYDHLPKGDDQVWVNAALGEYSSDVRLYVTRYQTNTSLLRPNRKIIDRIYPRPDDFDIVKEVTVPCTTLDDAALSAGLQISALKADTQGTELSILRGAKKCLLETLLAVELEVEFTELYAGQPLFSDVDTLMRKSGFMLADLGNLVCHKWRHSSGLGGFKGQLLAADALYMRTPDSLEEVMGLADEPLTVLSHYWAVCAVYGYLDLAYESTIEISKESLCAPSVMKEVEKWAYSNRKKGGILDVRGRGRFASWLRKLADEVEPAHHTRWINPLGNA